MTIIHYSADAFLSAAAPNPSCWQSHSCPAPVHTCLWAGNCKTSQQWLQSGDSSWNSWFFPACGLLVLLTLPLLAPHCTEASNCCKKKSKTLELNSKSKLSPAPDSWIEAGNIPGLHCDPSLWEWVWRGVWSNTEIRQDSAMAVKWD